MIYSTYAEQTMKREYVTFAEKVGRVAWTEAKKTRTFTTCPPYYLTSSSSKAASIKAASLNELTRSRQAGK